VLPFCQEGQKTWRNAELENFASFALSSQIPSVFCRYAWKRNTSQDLDFCQSPCHGRHAASSDVLRSQGWADRRQFKQAGIYGYAREAFRAQAWISSKSLSTTSSCETLSILHEARASARRLHALPIPLSIPAAGLRPTRHSLTRWQPQV
jgi:hypothetical protein